MIDFREIIGHEKPIQILKNRIKFNRIGHAYLFTGNDGIGKKLTAIAFSKAINCHHLSQEQNPCNQCISCLKIEKGNSPDLDMIYPADYTIKIDQIREIKNHIYLRPLENRKKIYIINKAEKMTIEASNSLLKILEEPPEFAMIILITAFPDTVLPTILSRCCQLPFKPLHIEHQREILIRNITTLDGNKELEDIIRLSYLNTGKAFSLAGDQQQLAQKKQFIELLAGMKPEEMMDVIFYSEKFFDKIKNYFQDFIEVMILWFRDVLMLQMGREKSKLILRERIDEIQDYAKYYSREKIMMILDYLVSIQDKIEKHINPKMLLENIFIQLGDE